jgi:Flp pilus assembly protein TadG
MFASMTKSTLGIRPDPTALAQLPHFAAHAAARARNFRDNMSGSTMMIFGLTIFPVFFFVGVSLDFSRMITARSQALAAADAAALAGARTFQTGATATAAASITGSRVTCPTASGAQANAQIVACNYLTRTLSQNVVNTTVSFPTSTNGSDFTVKTQTWVKTPFLFASKMLGSTTVANAPTGCTVGGQCQSINAQSMTIAAPGGSGSIEVSMMIDITGSMGESDNNGSTKIETVKAAANDAVDILIWSDQSKYTSKIALVPFSPRVNVGSYASAVLGLPPTLSTTTSKTKDGNTTYTTTVTNLIPCVTERTGTEAYTDAAPANNKWTGAYVGQSGPGQNSALVIAGNTWNVYNDGSSNSYNGPANYNSSGTCSAGNDPGADSVIIPLTSNKAVLKAEISKLAITGSTAGHLGTAWAWYMISPNWSSIWPSASQPSAYNTASVKKIAILMTDGDYNTQYSSTGSQAQAGFLCANMKAAGIEVYTIGDQVSSSAKAFLTSCATNAAHYYDATDGVKLKAAFRDIALKISTLRIAK